MGFLGPYAGGEVGERLLAEVEESELAEHPMEYRPQRAERDQGWQPYQGVLRTLELAHPDDAKRKLSLRVLVVWSPAKARLDVQLRQTNLAKLEASLKALADKLNRRPYPKRETVEKRLRHLLNHTRRGGS
jgi:hypothetical protein